VAVDWQEPMVLLRYAVKTAKYSSIVSKIDYQCNFDNVAQAKRFN